MPELRPSLAVRLSTMPIAWLLASEIEYITERRDALTDGRRAECTHMIIAINAEITRRQEVRA